MRLLRYRKYTNNRTWEYEWGGSVFFAKALSNPEEASSELRGHDAIKSSYTVPTLRHWLRIRSWHCLVYDRWPSVGDNGKLMLDVVTDAERTGDHAELNNLLDAVLQHYCKVFSQTMLLAKPQDLRSKLYVDRIVNGGRISQYYGSDKRWLLKVGDRHVTPSSLKSLDLSINGRNCQVDFPRIISRLREQLISTDKVISCLTQGDPTDRNIGYSSISGPVWFDFDGAGLNSLAGEFACFLMYQRLHGAWLTPMYNKTLFQADYPQALESAAAHAPVVDIHTANNACAIEYRFLSSDARKHVMRRYLDELVYPLATRAGINDVMAWLRPYILMRVLAVYDISDMAAVDAALSLSLMSDALREHTNLEEFLGISESTVA